MAKRDPETTERNRLIVSLSEELKEMLPDVLSETGINSEHALHGKIGSKNANYIDIRHEIIHSPDHFVSLWLEGFREVIEGGRRNGTNQAERETFEKLRSSKLFQQYLFTFLRRTYLRNWNSLSRRRPNPDEAEIWLGQNNANWGLLVTPRFVDEKWENDGSEIRHFKKAYWTVGHVLETGLLLPNRNRKRAFSDVQAYLDFFLDVLVRNSGSKYEYQLAEMYCDYVRESKRPEEVPLLIPEFRYSGIEKDHKYRIDFTIITNPEQNRIGFELSPWSTHGYLLKTKALNQKQINELAANNFANEMRKHKDYFRKHGVFILIYTDEDLADLSRIFRDMKKYLTQSTAQKQLKLNILKNFFK